MMRMLLGALSAGAFALATLFPDLASAQAGTPSDEHSRRWGVSVAASHQSVNDEIASPLRQTGVGPAFGVLYRSRGNLSDWGVRLGYGSPSLKPASAGVRHGSEDVHDFVLGFHYLRRLSGSDGARFATWVGAGSDVRLVVRIHHYGELGNETYADGFAPLEAQGMWTYATGTGGVLSERLAVAVVSAVARDPYTGAKYAPSVELASALRTPMLRHVLGYRFRMGSSFDGVLSHELTYLRYPEPRHMVMATQELRLALEWKR